MKNIMVPIVLTITMLCGCQYSLYAQSKKGKIKEKSAFEKKADSLAIVIQLLESEKLSLDSLIEQCKTENAHIAGKLGLANVLTATNIKIDNLNTGKGGKPGTTTKAKDVNKTSVSFEFIDNDIVSAGSKTINIVLYDNKGKVVSSSGKEFKMKKKNVESSFSAEANIEYKIKMGKNKVDIKHNKKLLPGNFRVEIYTDGFLSGISEFSLE